ncbi:MAG TPA: DUF2147 domain-containing protein [Thermodesulfovibrionales bacterium]|nr:DUF2147 domain-containing protein [Thermodesulfovibrionales bacterium]
MRNLPLTYRSSLIMMVLLITCVAAVVWCEAQHRNFHAIAPGEACRSAQLDGDGLDYYIKKYHIRSLLNLRRMVFTSAVLAAGTTYGAGPDDILGVWNTEEKDAKIEIYKCSFKYCGKIVWLKEPVYQAGSKDGTPGAPIMDHNNPNPELRKTPLIGLPILLDFVYAGDNSWKDGKIYNSDNGKTYSGKLTLPSPDLLKVRGFIGIPLIGGSTTWTR